MDEEEWRPVSGWEAYYEVSNLGRVKRLARESKYKNGSERFYPEVIRKGSVSLNGYLTFRLGLPEVYEFRTAHRMVAEAFIPNPKGFRIVRHLDDDKLNNRVENLAWGTDSDNRKDAVRNGRDFWTKRTHCKNGHEFTPENTRLDGGSRVCRQCDRDRGAKYRASQRYLSRNGHKPTYEMLSEWNERNR